jgi:transposase
VAFALCEKPWKLGCPTGHGHQPRVRQEVAQAKSRCGLSDTAPGVSDSAAGREGVWLHRFLQAHGSTTHVVDASSLAGNRRQRRAKSDGLDVRKLVSMRFQHGDRDVWRVVHVPSVEAEDQRQRHRALATLPQERARTTTRIQGLLRSQGIRRTSLRKFSEPLDALRLWEGSSSPRGLRRRVLRG